MKLHLSSQAYISIFSETYAHIHTETGGVFLGKIQGDSWYVIEVIDPGYSKIQRHSSYFEYDEVYVTHLANIRSRLYKNGLDLLGLWHRHPGSFDIFSGQDDDTHREYIKQCPTSGIISSLVNIDPSFRMTHYFIDSSITHTKLTNVFLGDEHIPKHFLDLSVPQSMAALRNNKETTPEESEYCIIDLSSREETVFGMFENELLFLETQGFYDFSYKYDDRNNFIYVKLKFSGNNFDRNFLPSNLNVKIYVENDKPSISINNTADSYTNGYIKTYIEGLLKHNIK